MPQLKTPYSTQDHCQQIPLNQPPVELVDLVRFIAAHHRDVLEFIHRECPEDIRKRVPSLQGARQIFAAQIIAEQSYAAKNLSTAVKWLLENPNFGNQ